MSTKDEDIYRIESIIVLPPKTMTAVYYIKDSKDSVIWRNPVVFVVVINTGAEEDEIEFWDRETSGDFEDCTIQGNFLGFEFNGESADWANEIDAYKMRHR